jgi:hypothetical protein
MTYRLRLLEDLTVLHGLTLELILRAPKVLYLLLDVVRRFESGPGKLGPVVPVGIVIGVLHVLHRVTTEQPETLDFETGFFGTQNIHDTKRPLADFVTALLEATDGITRHERARVFFLKLVILVPQAPSLAVKVFPKVGHGFVVGLGIRVGLFPGVHGKG